MKDMIIKALDELQKQYNIEQPIMNRMQILSTQELADAECTSVEESTDLWGEYKFAVLYSDFPDYSFFNNETISFNEIKNQLSKWLQWCNIIK